MNPLLLAAAVIPVGSTLAGGLVALRFHHRLHPVMAFAAGVLLATAALDLLPESSGILEHAGMGALSGVAFLLGLLGYTAIESLLERGSYEHAEQRGIGAASLLGPAGLVIHSSLDGVAIGLGFASATSVGILVAAAVIAHDFADGLNVVTLALSGGAGRRGARVLLIADAMAVPAGVLLGSRLGLDPLFLGCALGVFAGVFVAIGAGHLLPEARHQRPDATPLLIALAGAGAVLVSLVRLALG